MIKKNEAIEILDEYLRLEYNLDPHCTNLSANRMVLDEENIGGNCVNAPKVKNTKSNRLAKLAGPAIL